VLPVHPIAILNQHGDGTADRFARADTRQELHLIRFDGHAAPAAVTALAAPELLVDSVNVHAESGREAFENDDERAAVRFARGEKPQHAAAIVYEVSATLRARARV
jgi:hypothetical protein